MYKTYIHVFIKARSVLAFLSFSCCCNPNPCPHLNSFLEDKF